MKSGRMTGNLPRVSEVSAGGFVLASEAPSRIALIGRKTRGPRLEWCVPKGHLEGTESAEQAAIREIFEETGLEVEILAPLGQVEYEFSGGGKLISKTVHHFLMRQIGGRLTVENDPQQEAVDAQWFDLDELDKVLVHDNEKRMARGVQEWVARN